MTGWLATFTPCGHTAHCPSAPETGSWLSHWTRFAGPGPACQTPRQVAEVKRCPGCPECWQQPGLFEPGRAA